MAYNHRFAVRRIALYQTLGFNGDTIPKNANMIKTIELINRHNDSIPGGPYQIKVTPATGAYSAHRIFVTCKCGRTIPTGRFAQHAPSCQALSHF